QSKFRSTNKLKFTYLPVCPKRDTISILRMQAESPKAICCILREDLGMKISKVVVVGDLYVGKTSLINRFCKDNFDRDYKATIGVDFEMERFEIIGMPYNLQIWDTAGQEKFKCIASAYYRGAEVIITVFDLADIQTLDHTKQWLEDALRENEPDSSFIFLVGTKKDLDCSVPVLSSGLLTDVLVMLDHLLMWENVKEFFSRVAALAFEQSMIKELENTPGHRAQIGEGNLISKWSFAFCMHFPCL
uniref:Ras-related protein Rab-36 n=1 Tax=Malurus cyaneus samueli TaxID=2593467 RepID=A0A8C5X9U5_9PASS